MQQKSNFKLKKIEKLLHSFATSYAFEKVRTKINFILLLFFFQNENTMQQI